MKSGRSGLAAANGSPPGSQRTHAHTTRPTPKLKPSSLAQSRYDYCLSYTCLNPAFLARARKDATYCNTLNVFLKSVFEYN